MQIAVNTDWFERAGAHPYIIKELKKRNLYTDRVDEADVVWNIDSIHHVGIKKGKKLTIYWELDDFMIAGRNKEFYDQADILYINMPEYMYFYPPKTKVLRVACDPEIHKEYPVEKDFDYAFIGSIEPLPVYRERIFLLDKLLKHSMKIGQKILISHGAGEQYMRLMSRGKIILDFLPQEPNGNVCIHMRLYESMAVGCLMVHYHPFLDKLFTKNEHYVTLDRFGVMTETEIKRIKENSRRLMIEKHTWSHRVDQVLEDIYERIGQ